MIMRLCFRNKWSCFNINLLGIHSLTTGHLMQETRLIYVEYIFRLPLLLHKTQVPI